MSISKLRIIPILEAVDDTSDEKIIAVSIGSAIEIRKADGSSALYLESSSSEASRYNKVEDKDLELPVLKNELAGLVGGFDASVHKLMQKYGYEWVNPADKEDAAPNNGASLALESIKEANGNNPTGTWVGDYYVNDAINISAFVDAAADLYSFDDQKIENKFRSKIKEMIKELVGEMFSPEDNSLESIKDCVTTLTANMSDELSEFQDYYTS